MADALSPPAVPDEPPGEDVLTPEDLHTLVRTQIDSAVSFVDGTLSPARARLARYYEGELPDIDAPEGRSQAVATVVRDAIIAMKPGLLRAFFGPERVVEFRPRRADAVEQAQQQTEYVNYIVTEDNPGLQIFSAALEDALVKDFGILKWWWEETQETQGSTYEHLTLPQLEQLMANEPGITIESIEPNQFGGLKVALSRVNVLGRARIAAVPPEEFLFTRNTRSLDTATFVAHRAKRTVSDLVAMGYDREQIEEAAGSGAGGVNNEETLQRLEWDAAFDDEDDGPGGEAGEALRKVKYVECYLQFDQDGDGIAELRKVCCVGEDYTIVHNAPADERPFAVMMADPKPHTLQGRGVARRVDANQAIQSVVLRGMLDSLNLSLVPWQEVVEGMVNMKDVLNPEMGKVIRVKAPGMLQTGKHQFNGPDTMPVLDYFEGKREDATGTSRASAGLNPDALQSSTKAAVAATVTGAQQQTELIARFLAETGLKPLFKGLYKLLKRHQTEARTVQLFGKYVEVNPTAWEESDPDVTVNVALGLGLIEDKIASLTAIGMDQKEILMTMGLQNPICTVAQYTNTLQRKVKLAGWQNTSEFYNEVPPDWQPPPQQPPEPPPPDPVAVQLAQIEAQKVQGQQALAEAEFAHKRDMDLAKIAQDEKQMEYDYNLKRDQMFQDAELARIKAKADVDAAEAKASVAKAEQAAVSPNPGV